MKNEDLKKLLKRMFILSRETYYSGFSQQDVYEHDTFEDCLKKMNLPKISE